MARILAFSSQVAFGHVGLSATVPALQAMGHEVIAVPTVVLSSHFGYEAVSGFSVTPDQVHGIIDALAVNGWMGTVDAVMTGYMPSVELVEGLAQVLSRLGSDRPDVLYLCDPVLGDDPHGLYVPEEVAGAIRDLLVPLADIVTPNRFELSWLTGESIETAAEADTAADLIGADLVAVTSVPAGNGQIANLMSDMQDALQFTTPLRTNVPQGTGDLFAALVLGHILAGAPHGDAVARASAGVQTVIEESIGAGELRLVSCIAHAVEVPPAEAMPV